MLNCLHILSRNHCSTTDDCSIGDFFLAQGRLFPLTQRIVALCRMAPLVQDDSAWGRAATDNYRSALYQYNHNLRVSLLDKRRPEAYDPITFVIRKRSPPPVNCIVTQPAPLSQCDVDVTLFTTPATTTTTPPCPSPLPPPPPAIIGFFQEGGWMCGGYIPIVCVPG